MLARQLHTVLRASGPRTSRLTSLQAAYASGAGVHGNDPAVLQREKDLHLQGKSESPHKDVPGWSEKLASDAEAAVKADKHHKEDASVEHLQEHSVKHLEKTHGKGKK